MQKQLSQILAEYSDKTAEQLENPRVNLRVAGRIMAIRLMGKAGFAHLQQAGEKLSGLVDEQKAKIAQALEQQGQGLASKLSNLTGGKES